MDSIALESGVYVVAVSGGVDSMVLLDLLSKLSGLELIVAHYDHGIRAHSSLDRQFVEQVAKDYGLQFVYEEGRLGPDASEATSRYHRYDFLGRTCKDKAAQAIVTAHHQDDVIETAILNLMRGTGRKGLSSLQSSPTLRRPLLGATKVEITQYAKGRGLSWREDPSNDNLNYRRNYVRHKVLTNMSNHQRQQMLGLIKNIGHLNQQIDQQLESYLYLQPAGDHLRRHDFVMLPHDMSREVMAAWLRKNRVERLDARLIERLAVAGKVMSAGKAVDVSGQHIMEVDKQLLRLRGRGS